jgi:UDPglucose 6-dehydrogenase
MMRYPIIVDGRNLYEPQTMLENGFTYLSVGRPAVYPARESVLSPA